MDNTYKHNVTGDVTSDNGWYIGAQCMVEMKDGSTKMVCDLLKGDCVKVCSMLGLDSPVQYDEVEYVVETCEGGLNCTECRKTPSHEMVVLGALRISPQHCIWEDNQWLPAHTCEPLGQSHLWTHYPLACGVVLKERSLAVLVEGRYCTTLGHGVNYGQNIHHFYDTEKVVQAIERVLKPDGAGRAILHDYQVVRDPYTRNVKAWADTKLMC